MRTDAGVAPVASPGCASDDDGCDLSLAREVPREKPLLQWLGKGGVVPARSLEFASYQAMIACVAAGTGFAIVPLSVLKALRVTADVRRHVLPARVRTSRTHLVWRGEPSVALRGLLELLGRGTDRYF